MAEWKKIVVSGSNAELNSLAVGNNQDITTNPTTTKLSGSFSGSFQGDGSGITGLTLDNALTAGTGISSAGTYDGSVARTFDLALSEVPSGTIVSASGVSAAGDTVMTKLSDINLSSFNNDAGFTDCVGDITAVTAGPGIFGGGTTGGVTVSVNSGSMLPYYSSSIFATVSGDVTITAGGVATIGNDAVALGTNTTGNYVATITGGTGITSTGATTGEGIAHSLSVNLAEISSGTIVSASGVSAAGDTVNTALSAINISSFNNDAGFTDCIGTVTSVTVSAGNGLTGGGTITTSGTATLNVGAGTGIDVAADAISVDVSDFMTNGSNNRVVTATGTDAMNAEANLTFDGSTLTVTGDAVVTGTLTAQEFKTELVSASILYQSGSTKFGDTSDDVHSFSGSLRVTGSGDHYIIGGNVGIGTISPSKALDIRGNTVISGSFTGVSAFPLTLVNTFASDPGFLNLVAPGIGSNDGMTIVQETDVAGRPFVIQTTQGGGWGNLTLQRYGGSLGIGTVSPTAKLDVRGSAVFNEDSADVDFRVESNNNANMLFVDGGNDRVGIGTNTPGSTLDVAGNVRFQYADSSTTLSSGGSILRLANSNSTVNNIAAIDFPQTSGGSGFSRIGIIYKDRTSSSEDQDMFFRTIGGGSSAEVLRLTSTGNVGIGTTSPSYKLEVNGSFAATTKSFVIDNPVKGGKLQYGVLEGPEHSVFYRGKTTDTVIELPEEWQWLVDYDTITVQLTPIRSFAIHSVNYIKDNKIFIESQNGKVNCYFLVHAERKDVEKLKVDI